MKTCWIAALFLLIGAAPAQERPVGMVTDLRGDVKIFAPGDAQGKKAALAALLPAGSRLTVAAGGSATFLYCPQSILAEAAAGSDLVLSATSIETKKGAVNTRGKIPACQLPVSRASADRRIGGTTLRGEKGLILCYPAGTSALATDVRFRWLPVEGASRYRLLVRSEDGEDLWETETAETQLAYAGPRPLQPGQRYRWQVTSLQNGEVQFAASAWVRTLTSEQAEDLSALMRPALAGSDRLAHDLMLAMALDELQLPEAALPLFESLASQPGTAPWVAERATELRQRLHLPPR
jgi:hypothetical protein